MKKTTLPALADHRLHDIRYCIQAGLRKLVPVTGIGLLAYTQHGVIKSHSHEDFGEPAAAFLTVSLSLSLPDKEGSYSCFISLQDGDDWMLQRWLPFTWENWCHQLDSYSALTRIDGAMLDRLALEGFR